MKHSSFSSLMEAPPADSGYFGQENELTFAIKHYFFKRIFDISFSLAFLILASPFFALIAIAIKLSSSGTIFYSQPRLGRGGVIFNCYKFRTMYENADQVLADLLQSDKKLQEEWKRRQKLKNDPRIFNFGKFLRKTSLDELPQFWNVLLGDLSIVGPRPYMVNQLKDLGRRAGKILSVRPGITGLWQTTGRSRTTYQKRILLDEQYVLRRSFLLDLLLIAKTIPAVLIQKDAY